MTCLPFLISLIPSVYSLLNDMSFSSSWWWLACMSSLCNVFPLSTFMSLPFLVMSKCSCDYPWQTYKNTDWWKGTHKQSKKGRMRCTVQVLWCTPDTHTQTKTGRLADWRTVQEATQTDNRQRQTQIQIRTHNQNSQVRQSPMSCYETKLQCPS